MCGIAGTIGFPPEASRVALNRMLSRLRHRGPDDEGIEFLSSRHNHSLGVYGLGFRRLAIVDLSVNGRQPMRDPGSGDCLVFNGEVYNYKALRRRVLSSGRQLKGTSDTEVLLHWLSLYGAEGLAAVEGMFAFAFYDATESRLLLARDGLGIKPLYIARARTGALVFASEVRAVIASGVVSDGIEPLAAPRFLTNGAMPGLDSFYSAVQAFPPGQYGWFAIDSTGQLKEGPLVPYWPRLKAISGHPPKSDPVREVRNRTQAAVESHLAADVEVGLFLSAGIDSTIIAACAAKSHPGVNAFTVAIAGDRCADESLLARETARRSRLRHHRIEVSDDDLQRLWFQWLEDMDSPSIDGLNTYIICEAVAAQGIKVGLSGLGADELFGGYPAFRAMPRLLQLQSWLGWMPVSVQQALTSQAAILIWGRDRAGKATDILSEHGTVQNAVFQLRRVFSSNELRQMGFHAVRNPDTELASRLLKSLPFADTFNQVSVAELTSYMGDMLLRDADTNSMAHSLELRVPFLEKNLVEYVLSLPAEEKSPRYAPPKYLLRAAFSRELGNTISRRKKTGFAIPVAAWMRGETRAFCEDKLTYLYDAFPPASGFARRLWARFQAQRESIHWSRPLALVLLGCVIARNASSASGFFKDPKTC